MTGTSSERRTARTADRTADRTAERNAEQGVETNPARAAEEKARGRGDRATSSSADRRTRVTVLVALAANLVIAVAKAVGGLFAGSPALLSEAAHSVADSLNEVFLLAALRRSRRPADARHPFGYGKERFFWSLLAAVGIFVMGGCFSFFQGVEALRSGVDEKLSGYVVGLVVLGVAFLAEGASLLRALHQVRKQGGGLAALRDPALRTVVAEDGTAVLGVTLAAIGMVLHMVTGQVVWEASASLAIGALLVYVAYRLGREARDQLIGEAADPETGARIRALLDAQPEIDSVEALFTMKMGLDAALVAARVDLMPGLDSERVEEIAVRIKRSIAATVPEADQIFLDVTDRGAREAGESPAATGNAAGPDGRVPGGSTVMRFPRQIFLRPRRGVLAGRSNGARRDTFRARAEAGSAAGCGLHDEHRDLPVGLLLVVRVRRKRGDGAFPPLGLLRTGDLTGRHVLLQGAVLELHQGVGLEVVVPDRVLGRPALRGDQGVAAVVLDPHQRRLAELPALRAPGRQQDDGQSRVPQRRPLGAAGALVLLHLLAHPLRRAGFVLAFERHGIRPLRHRAASFAPRTSDSHPDSTPVAARFIRPGAS